MKINTPRDQTANNCSAPRRGILRCGALAVWLLGCMALAGFAPPSGRPPIGPLQRYEPKVYDLEFGVAVQTLQQVDARDKWNYQLKNAPIVMPIIFLSTFNKTEFDSVRGKLWLESHETNPNLVIKDGFPHNTHMATITIEEFVGQSVRWQVGYRTQVWSSRINDEEAQKIPWPKEWPKEVQDGLQPQMYIQSDDP